MYSATISHDIKQTVAKGKPPMTGKVQEILDQAENAFQRQHRFKPEINHNRSAKNLQAVPREERQKKLYEPRTEHYQLRDQQRSLREMAEVQEHCTFKPHLNTNGSKAENNNT